MNNKLTVVVIAKNEEKQITACLKSAVFADEIVFIDSGSTDNTVNIAKKCGAKVFEVKFSNFSDLRNIGREKAVNSWIFYLDADEEITKELKAEILKTIRDVNAKNCYLIKRSNYYLGRKWPVDDTVEKLFRKEYLKNWYGEVHESPTVIGEKGELINPLIHRTHNNLEEMLNNTIVWSDFEAKARFEANHPKITWWRIFRMMLTSFWDSYVRQKGWTVGTVGLIESMYQSFSTFVTYAKLWEMQNNL